MKLYLLLTLNEIMFPVLLSITLAIFTHIMNAQKLSLNQKDSPLEAIRYNSSWLSFIKKHDIQTDITYKQISIEGLLISKQGFQAIFATFNTTQLKILTLQNVRLTKQAFQAISKQSFFPQLQAIIFKNCNLRSEHFQVLTERQVSWKELSLEQNFISKLGFQYLSRISMNLEKLNLRENSLLESESVDILIGLGLSEIKCINLVATSISPDNIVRLLNHLNLEELEQLQIGCANYPLSFYQQLSKMKLEKLELLNLQNLMIDNKGGQCFSNWSLPQLKALNLTENALESDLLIDFINRQNLPKLQHLDISFNFFTYQIFDHLASQGYQFQVLNFSSYHSDSKLIESVNKLDFSKMEVLATHQFKMVPESIKKVLSTHEFPLLRKLDLTGVLNAGNILRQIVINHQHFPSLQYLDTAKINKFSDILDEANKYHNILPKLRQLSFTINNIKSQYLVPLIEFWKRAAPNLQILFITGYQLAIQQVFQYLISCPNITINGSLIVKVEEANTIYGYRRYQKLLDFKIIQSKISILHIDAQYLLYVQKKSSRKNTTQIVKIIESEFMQKFNFKEMVSLEQKTHQYSLLRVMRQQLGSSCQFTHLQTLQIKLGKQSSFEDLGQCVFPNLRYLIVEYDSNTSKWTEDKFKKLAQAIRSFDNLLILQIDGEFPTFFVTDILVNSSLQFVTNLLIWKVPLRPDNFRNITENFKYIENLRSLYLQNTLVYTNISVITSPKLLLRILEIQFQLIETDMDKLCELNTEFMKGLSLVSCGLDNTGLIKFLDCKQDKMFPVFPKLQILELSMNQIEQSGTRKLMQSGLQLLNIEIMLLNLDPESFNTIFSSPYARRIQIFWMYDNEVESFLTTIQPNCVSNIIEFVIVDGQSLEEDDYKTLSRMNFFSLKQLVLLDIQTVSCTILRSIHQMAKNTFQIQIQISDNDPFYDEICEFSDLSTNGFGPSSIIYDANQYYASHTNFISKLLHPQQQYIAISLYNVYLDELMLKDFIQKTNLRVIETIILDDAGIGDEAASSLLTDDIQTLNILMLDNNQEITEKSLKKFQNITFTLLESLSFQRTSIGDEGLRSLVTNSFPRLTQLDLTNIDLTKKGLSYLNQLDAPSLIELNLSCNQFDVIDLQKVNFGKFKNLKRLLLYPKIQIDDWDILYQKISLQLDLNQDDQEYFEIIADIIHL